MRNRILAVLFLAILAILAGWFIFKPARKVEATALVEKEDLVLTTSISGKLKASREATLSFPISGKITQIASVSAAVAEGGILATLDTFDLYAAYRSSLFSLSKSYSSYYNAVEAKAELDATYAGREGDNIVKAKLAEGRTDVEAAAAAVAAAASATVRCVSSSEGSVRANSLSWRSLAISAFSVKTGVFLALRVSSFFLISAMNSSRAPVVPEYSLKTRSMST